MSKTSARDLAIAELRESPFFILSGPGGRQLACQWTNWDQHQGRARGIEFEIICPETPVSMGCLYGVFESRSFRMRPAVKTVMSGGIPAYFALAPELDLDLEWRGTIDDVIEVGHDLEMGSDGLLYIHDPEEPVSEECAPALALAA